MKVEITDAKQLKWIREYTNQARDIARRSEDRSTKVGAVIVNPDLNCEISTGYNGFPRGVLDIEGRHERPIKYEYTEHAERNAIYNAARIGVSTKGCYLFLNWVPTPCADCARAIIQAGIDTVFGYGRDFPSQHYTPDKLSVSEVMFREAGVKTCIVPVNPTAKIYYEDWRKS